MCVQQQAAVAGQMVPKSMATGVVMTTTPAVNAANGSGDGDIQTGKKKKKVTVFG